MAARDDFPLHAATDLLNGGPSPLPELDYRRDVAAVLSKLKVKLDLTESPPALLVDASDCSDKRPLLWMIFPKADDPTLWNHPQSHYDEWFSLGDVLLGIASCYTARHEPTTEPT